MSKKKWLIIILVILGIVVGGTVASYFFFFKGNGEKSKSSKSFIDEVSQKGPETVASEVYEDEAGFSFNYPKGIKIEDKTPDDSVSYSLLELSGSGDKLTVWVFDIKEKSIEEWVKNSSKYKEASLTGATTLAGITAKQYEMGDAFLTTAYKDGVMYLIEGPKDDKWTGVQNTVVESFSLQGLGSSSSSSDGTVYEQEIVE